MTEPVGELAPQAADQAATDQSPQPADVQLFPPDSKRGGALTVATLPEAIQGIIEENPRSLASDAGTRLLLGWAWDMQNRLSASEHFRERQILATSESQAQLATEKEKRAVAEVRLASQTEIGTLQKVLLATGVGIFGFAIEHPDQPLIVYPLGIVGLGLILVSIFAGRSSK